MNLNELIERHDEKCELNRVDWPQFKEWTDPITGKTHPAGPYPCHCFGRATGIRKAERENARVERAANACLECYVTFRTPENLMRHLRVAH